MVGARRGGRRARPRVHRPGAAHRLDLGSPHVGHLLGLGPAHHVHHVAVRDARGVPRPPADRQRERAMPRSAAPAARSSGLLLFPNVVVVHFSVDWWRSLHQTATITRLDPDHRGHDALHAHARHRRVRLPVRLVADPPVPHRRGSRSRSEPPGSTRRWPSAGPRPGSPSGSPRGPARDPGATHTGYIAAAWGGSLVGALPLYALRTVRRGRALSRRVPPGGPPVELSPRSVEAPRSPSPEPDRLRRAARRAARARRRGVEGPVVGLAVLLQRRRGRGAASTSWATSASACRAPCSATACTTTANGVEFTVAYNGVRVEAHHARRPAGAVRARASPSCSRGAGIRRVTSSPAIASW